MKQEMVMARILASLVIALTLAGAAAPANAMDGSLTVHGVFGGNSYGR
jgi:hypothetical protein